MDLWISMYNTQMANNLVKWWKTKFLNGYKQFSVECGNAKVSDTEELLGRLGSEEDANERLRVSCTTPPLQPKEGNNVTTTTTTSSGAAEDGNQHQLNFEEFSCDVSVEKNGGDTNKCPQERQEFSFTLYDFDGHGKITKDDIAGLVTTIYEALGSSVKVPHYGSKTIKVKLTVSPDQRKHMSATIINNNNNDEEKDNQNHNESNQSIRYKRDLNVTIRQGNDNHTKRKLKRHNNLAKSNAKCCNNHQKQEPEVEVEDEAFLSDEDSSEEVGSRLSGQLMSSEDEGEVECSDGNTERLPSRPKRAAKKCNKSKYSPRYTTVPNVFMRGDTSENTCSVKTKSMKKPRSGSLQRQELLDIIQANMDKNNLGFQTARKHSNHVGATESKLVHQHNTHNKRAANPLQYLAHFVDPTHFYVDLASLQNTTQLPQNNYQYDKLIDAVMCVSSSAKKAKQQPLKCRKHRSKDATQLRYQFAQHPGEEPRLKTNKRVHKKSNVEVKCFNKSGSHVVTGHTSSPHYLRHRNRQEDQARAMAQVVRWLEQEFSSNLNTSDKEKSKKGGRKEKIPSARSAAVERHEHHHVHEHIHHHYHHYQDVPLVV